MFEEQNTKNEETCAESQRATGHHQQTTVHTAKIPLPPPHKTSTVLNLHFNIKDGQGQNEYDNQTKNYLEEEGPHGMG